MALALAPRLFCILWCSAYLTRMGDKKVGFISAFLASFSFEGRKPKDSFFGSDDDENSKDIFYPGLKNVVSSSLSPSLFQFSGIISTQGIMRWDTIWFFCLWCIIRVVWDPDDVDDVIWYNVMWFSFFSIGVESSQPFPSSIPSKSSVTSISAQKPEPEQNSYTITTRHK